MSRANTKAACRLCLYARPLPLPGRNAANEVVPVAQCVIRPPTVLPDGKSAFPIVGLDDSWCGEFKTARQSAKRG